MYGITKGTAFVINNVDSVLSGLSNVITGYAIILDKCISCVNLVREIIDIEFPGKNKEKQVVKMFIGNNFL